MRNTEGEQEAVGRRVRELRIAKGWTAEEVARELGFGAAVITRIELARRPLRLVRLQQIAQVLGVDVADFFQRQPKRDKATNGKGKSKRNSSGRAAR